MMIDYPTFKKTATVVGYSVSCSYNNTDMWQDTDPRLATCPLCGIRREFFLTNPDYKTKGRFKPLYAPELIVNARTALSVTYDHQYIASVGFRDWCVEQGYMGLDFRELLLDPYHFHLVAENIVQFAAEIVGVQFLDYCPICDNYKSVIHKGMRILKMSMPLSDGFYRSDLLFASGRGKHPLLIVGTDTRTKLKAAKFKGLSFTPVYATPVPPES